MALLPIFLLLAAQKCPPQEDIYPCSCKLQTSGAGVFCMNLGTEVLMERALTHLKGHKFHQLTLSGINVSTLRPDLFKGLQIESLDLEKIEVEDASFRPGRQHFQGLEGTLETLDIKKSFKSRGLAYLQLNHLSHLKHAIFENNHIAEVGNDWFNGGPTGLSTLIFERNGIEVLGDKAFSSLIHLKTLAVAGNHIRDLKRSMFPQSPNELQMLDLAFNNLRVLPSDIFTGMPSLMDINLENNLIHLLQEETFQFILSGNIQVSMNGNPLVCDEKLKWICSAGHKAPVDGKCALPAAISGKTVHQFCEKEKSK